MKPIETARVLKSPDQTARVLVEALPYIRQFTGKSIVVKLGGAAIDKESDLALAQDVLLLRSVGVRCVLVHGGGPQVDQMLRRVGKEPEFRDGLRVTDAETLEIVRMVLVGKINRDLVATINSQAGDEPVAVGVSGEDAGLLVVEPADSIFGFVGNVTHVRAELLHRLLDDGLVPVVSTVGADKDGQPYNINADEAARAIAVSMNAEKIVYLTAAPGLLEDVADESSLVPRVTSRELRERIGSGSVSKGMIPKLKACADAVDQGVNFAHIIDGRVAHSLLIELLTDHGLGTMIPTGEELVKHLLSINDLRASDIYSILSLSEQRQPASRLQQQGVALYFEKPSSRTRNSMELAVAQLGGHPVYIQPAELGIGTRESVADVTRTLASYHAVIAARVFDHHLLEEMAGVGAAPILNLLSGNEHPLQALADLLTIKQLVGRLDGVKVAFIGEGNNVSRSLAQACSLVGADFTIASPPGFELAQVPGIRQVIDPADAVDEADVVYTDVWVSMGGDESTVRRAAFERYRVDDMLMARSANAWFMHCLPARRGEEVVASVIDGPRSAIWQQAANRMHSARGALLWMLDQAE